MLIGCRNSRNTKLDELEKFVEIIVVLCANQTTSIFVSVKYTNKYSLDVLVVIPLRTKPARSMNETIETIIPVSDRQMKGFLYKKV